MSDRPTRAPKRRGRHAIPRGRTLNRLRLRRQQRERERVSDEVRQLLADERPKTRGECVNGPRPCPWVGCKYHLYLDVNHLGSIKINHSPGLDVGAALRGMAETCTLDVADRGGHTLDEVGARRNVVKERVRQIEVDALVKMRKVIRQRDTWCALANLLRAIAQLGPMAGGR